MKKKSPAKSSVTQAPAVKIGSVALGLLMSLQSCPAWAEAGFHVTPKIPSSIQPPVVLPNPAVKPTVRLPDATPKPGQHTGEVPAGEPKTPTASSSGTGARPARTLTLGKPRPFLRMVRPEPNPAFLNPEKAATPFKPAKKPALYGWKRPDGETPVGQKSAPEKLPEKRPVVEKLVPTSSPVATKANPPVSPATQNTLSPDPDTTEKPAPIQLNAQGKPMVTFPRTFEETATEASPKPPVSSDTRAATGKSENAPPEQNASVQGKTAEPVAPIQRMTLSLPPVKTPATQEVVSIPLLGGKTLIIQSTQPPTADAGPAPAVSAQNVSDQKTDEAKVKELATTAQPAAPAADRPMVRFEPTYQETAGQVPVKKFPEPGQQPVQPPQTIALTEPVTEQKQPTEQERQALVHYRLGNEYGRNGKAKKAIQEYQMALKLNPDFKDGYVGLAAAYAARRKWKDSQRASYQALDGTGKFQYHNSPIQAHYNLAVAICALGNHQDSMAEYNLVKNARHPNAENLLEFIEKTCEP